MKKLLIALLLLVLVSPALGKITLYGEMKKDVNGGYIAKLPALEWTGEYENILLENELSLEFTAPREDMGKLNHQSVDNLFSMGFQNVLFYGDFITFGLGIRYYFDGNNLGIDEGCDFYNILRLGCEIF